MGHKKEQAGNKQNRSEARKHLETRREQVRNIKKQVGNK